MSENINTIVDYIFSTESTSTVFGEKMKQAAIKTKPENKQKQKEEEYQTAIREICDYDQQGCMCWIDYRSWITLPKKLQDSIEKLLHPKSWRGVIFQYDKWEEHERTILSNLSQDLVLILTLDQKKYRIHTIPLYKSYLDWITPSKFRELSQRLNKTAIKTYGRSMNNLYILDKNNNVEHFIITSIITGGYND